MPELTRYPCDWTFHLAAGTEPGFARVLLVNKRCRLALALADEFADPVDAIEAATIAAEALNRRDHLCRMRPSLS